MNTLGTGYGEPVRSLQTFLRKIAEYYTTIPLIVPDGIFGTQTRAAVVSFQGTFSLETTGEVDNATWDRLIEVYDDVLQKTGEPRQIKIYPSAKQVVYPPDAKSRHLFAIQGVLQGLTQSLPSLGTLAVTGVHDVQSVAVVKNIQTASGLPPTGVIDPVVWDNITRLYELLISRNRVEEVL